MEKRICGIAILNLVVSFLLQGIYIGGCFGVGIEFDFVGGRICEVEFGVRYGLGDNRPDRLFNRVLIPVFGIPAGIRCFGPSGLSE